MIRFAGAILALIFLIASFAVAQDSTPRVQVFGGYSLLHEDTHGLTESTVDFVMHNPTSTFGIRSNFNGWNAEAQYNVSSWVVFAADFAGYTGEPFTASNASGAAGLPQESRYSFLAGPVVSYRNKTRLTPYIHVLFGLERAHLDATTLAGSAPPFSTVATTFNDFAIAAGGGVDYRIWRRVALRLGQVDWYKTSLNPNKFYGSSFNSELFEGLPTRQKNVRFSAGIVVNF
jgi:opacity protein-like surface antigen